MFSFRDQKVTEFWGNWNLVLRKSEVPNELLFAEQFSVVQSDVRFNFRDILKVYLFRYIASPWCQYVIDKFGLFSCLLNQLSSYQSKKDYEEKALQ